MKGARDEAELRDLRTTNGVVSESTWTMETRREESGRGGDGIEVIRQMSCTSGPQAQLGSQGVTQLSKALDPSQNVVISGVGGRDGSAVNRE